MVYPTPTTVPISPEIISLEKRKATLLLRLEKLNKALDAEQSKIPIVCTTCQASHPIGTLTYIQTHWYVQPHGCTGGDYWNEGEGNFKCPTCGTVNRMYNREDYQKLKYRFKDIVKTHDR